MGVLGIHPLDSQYKVTAGNVARPDFLNFFLGRSGLVPLFKINDRVRNELDGL
jgi:hypothetical protein